LTAFSGFSFFYTKYFEELEMKKGTEALLHLILAGVISVIGYLGFKKGMEILQEKMEKKNEKNAVD